MVRLLCGRSPPEAAGGHHVRRLQATAEGRRRLWVAGAAAEEPWVGAAGIAAASGGLRGQLRRGGDGAEDRDARGILSGWWSRSSWRESK